MQINLRRARVALVSSASVLAALTAAPALAQAEQEAETYDDNVIIVTAQRKEQSLQEVPIAVSAFSNEALESRQIENTSDLQLSLPNTTFSKGNFTGANLSIRGIGSAVVAVSADSGIGVHFNDLPIVNPRLFETEFYDLQRLEVLRGPQGTLFGRNATGGVINVITARPEAEFGAAGEVSYGSHNAILAKGMLNVPVGDIGGFRLAGLYQKRDGFTENLFTGNDIDGRDSFSLRGTIELNPSDDTRLTVVGQYYKEDSNRSRFQKQLCVTDPTAILGCRPDRIGFGVTNADATLGTILTSSEFFTVAGAGALAPFALGSVYGDDGNRYSNAFNPANVRQTSIDYEPTYRSDELIIQAELEHQFENFTVTLNGGYVDNSVRSRTDFTQLVSNNILANPGLLALRGAAAGGDPVAQLFLAQPLFNGNQICVSAADPLNAGFIAGRVDRCADHEIEFDESALVSTQWSVEGRIASDFDGPFNFLLGGLYLESEADGDYYVNLSGLDYAALLLGGGGGVLASPFFNNRTDSLSLKTYGIFGEAYLNVTDTLRFTAGLRYSNDRKVVRDRSALLTTSVPFGTTDVNAAIVTQAAAGLYDADPTTTCLPSGAGCEAFREQTARFNEITGRFVVDWKPEVDFTESTLIYVSFSRGYKPGGINPPVDPNIFEAPPTFDSEIINAVEIGTKNIFLDGVLQLNLTGFFYDYKGLQVSRIVNRTAFNDNTPAQTYGVELEAQIYPTRGLSINASLSYLKTKIKDLQLVNPRDPSAGRNDVVIIKDITNASNCAVVPVTAGSVPIANTVGLVTAFNNAATGGLLRAPVPVPGTNAFGAFSICGALAGFLNGVAPGTYLIGATPLGVPTLPNGVEVDLSGNELLNSPNWKFSVGAQYEIETAGGWTITPRADLHFTGGSFGTNFNDNVDRLKAYEIVNLQVTIASPDDRFYVRGFVQNLTNNQAVTGLFINDASLGLPTNIFTLDPQTYGIAAGFRF